MAAARGKYVDLPTPTGVQRWRLRLDKNLKGRWGEVDWDTKTIWLDPRQDRATLVATVIHEAGHIATGWEATPYVEAALVRMDQASVAMLLRLDLLATED